MGKRLIKITVLSSVLLLTLVGSVAYSLNGFSADLPLVKADPLTAGLSISKASLGLENKVATRFGNEVDIRGDFSLGGSSIELEANGYIGNYSSLRGIHSLTATFEGSLDLWVGYKQGILYKVGSLTSGASASLPDSPEARFFKIEATSSSTIESINIDLACKALEEEAEERLTNFVFGEGTVSDTINGGTALSVFKSSDGIETISLKNKTKSSMKAISIDGSISFADSFNSNFGASIFDLGEWTGDSLPGYSFYSATNFRILLSSSTTTLPSTAFNPYNTFTVYSLKTYSGTPLTVSGGTEGAKTAIQGKVRYYYPGSGEKADGIHYWSYNALNEHVAID